MSSKTLENIKSCRFSSDVGQGLILQIQVFAEGCRETPHTEGLIRFFSPFVRST